MEALSPVCDSRRTNNWKFCQASAPENLKIGVSGQPLIKSVDGGETWSPANSGIPQAYSRSIAIDPNFPSIIYPATQTYGIYKSLDEGLTWNPINTGISNIENLSHILVNPNSSKLYIAALKQSGNLFIRTVYSSDSGGQNWNEIGIGLPDEEIQSEMPKLTFDPNKPGSVYSGITTSVGGIYKLTQQ